MDQAQISGFLITSATQSNLKKNCLTQIRVTQELSNIPAHCETWRERPERRGPSTVLRRTRNGAAGVVCALALGYE